MELAAKVALFVFLSSADSVDPLALSWQEPIFDASKESTQVAPYTNLSTQEPHLQVCGMQIRTPSLMAMEIRKASGTEGIKFSQAPDSWVAMVSAVARRKIPLSRHYLVRFCMPYVSGPHPKIFGCVLNLLVPAVHFSRTTLWVRYCILKMDFKTFFLASILIYYFPLFYLQKGLVHEQRDEFHEAKICYQNAISVNPLHIKTLQHLVSLITSSRCFS